MGKKTGPEVLNAIESNDIEKLTEILTSSKVFRDKQKVRQFLVTEVRRSQSDNPSSLLPPLLTAASLDDPTILKYLVSEFNADVNHVQECGLENSKKSRTALTISARRRAYATVEAVLSLGADVNRPDYKGRTPLLQAVCNVDRHLVGLLLSRGARSDIEDSEGNLPLHVASTYGHVGLVKLLMKYDADPYKTGSDGRTSIHAAAREGHAVVLQVFGDQFKVDVNRLVQKDDVEPAKAAIHVAASEGQSDAVKALIESCSSDANLVDYDGNTALHYASNTPPYSQIDDVAEDRDRTIQILVDHGAQVDLRNNKGETPLHFAARHSGFSRIIDVLVRNGCDPALRDESGNMAIDILPADDVESRRILMEAFEEHNRRTRKAVVPGVKKQKKKLPTPTLESDSSLGITVNGEIGNGEMGNGVSISAAPEKHKTSIKKPRPAVRKTKSVEKLDQLEPEIEMKLSAPPPLPLQSQKSHPRVRSNSYQGGLVELVSDTQSNTSFDSIGSVEKKKKMGVLKLMKKGKKVVETEEEVNHEMDSFLPPPKVEKKMKVLKTKVILDEMALQGKNELQSTMSLNDSNSKHYNNSIPPKVPKNKPVMKKNLEKQSSETGVAKSNADLKSWLDEQAKLLRENEQSDQGGPVAQSTPPAPRCSPSSNEGLESSLNDSIDSDGNPLGRRRPKPVPPPKPLKVPGGVRSPNLSSSNEDFFIQQSNSPTVTPLKKGKENDIPSRNTIETRKPPLRESVSVPGGKTMTSNFGKVVSETNVQKAVAAISKKRLSGIDHIQPNTTNNNTFNRSQDSIRSDMSGRDGRDATRPLPKSRESRPPVGTNATKPAGSDSKNAKKPTRPALTSAGASDSESLSLEYSSEDLPIKKTTKEESPRKPLNLVFQKAAVNSASPPRKLVEDGSGSESSESSSEESDFQDDWDSEEERKRRQVAAGNWNATAQPAAQKLREITFYNNVDRTNSPPPFSLVGGNAEGIYVHALDPHSDAAKNGLFNGDQIIRANGQRIVGQTREEAAQMIRSFGGDLTLDVRFMPGPYEIVVYNGGFGDGFFVQAHFGYDSSKKGELTIHDGDVFSVTDSLPEGGTSASAGAGFWKVHKVNAKKNEEQIGMIPNKQKADQIVVKNRFSSQSTQGTKAAGDQRGGTFFRSFRNRSKSADRNSRASIDEELPSSPASVVEGGFTNVVSYQRVMQKISDQRRPVVVLGLFCDIVIKMLVRDSPEIYETPVEDIESARLGNEEPVNVRPIKGSFRRGKHCLLLLTPPSIEYLLQKTDINPIVIYISPVSKAVVKAVKAKLAPNYNKNAGYMYDEAVKFEKLHGQLFSTCVAYTTDDWWFFHLKEAIGSIQNQATWRPLTEEDLEAAAVAELEKISPDFVMPSLATQMQTRQGRDQTPRSTGWRTTDDLPTNGSGSGPSMRGRIEEEEVDGEHGNGSGQRSILKQRTPAADQGQGQAPVRNSYKKFQSLSFDDQQNVSFGGRTKTQQQQKQPINNVPNNVLSRETLL